jgi:hypothetical protein
MINGKAILYNILKTNTNLISKIGKIQNSTLPCIFTDYPASFNSLPCISYYEIDLQETDFADDEAIIEQSTLQIDIWSNTSTTEIFEIINPLLKANKFTLINALDIPDPQIKHKSIKYIIQKINI